MIFSRSRLLGVPYTPHPEEQSFVERAELQRDEELAVSVSVLDDRESERFFGVRLARKGIQPVWLRIVNKGEQSYRLHLMSLDPNYYSALEAAFINHYAAGKRLIELGILAWVVLPLLALLAPFKWLGARSSNRRMDAYFQEHGIGWGLIRPGEELSGFAFTSLDEGKKEVTVGLLGAGRIKQFFFSIPVPGLKVDHANKAFDDLYRPEDTVECDEGELRERLEELPRSTTNKRGTVEGDPLNLVAIGDFTTILNGFGGHWDETETLSPGSCWRTLKAFLLGAGYRYSPVSPLYVAGRSQDFALQKARRTINQRLHLRFWITPLRFAGKPVWIGQISRDIGVRFTLKTWNLTTHRIDPDIDDARDYALGDLMDVGRVSKVGYVAGVEAAGRKSPRHNLTGDPYFTDGLRAVAIFSEARTDPAFLDWA